MTEHLDTAGNLRTWLRTTEPGAVAIYHTGHLGQVTSLLLCRSRAEDARARALAEKARIALQAAEDGSAHLTQRRVGDGFEYLITRASRSVRGRRPQGEAELLRSMIRECFKDGASRKEIQERLNVSERTVGRALR